jgi:hypothetical protein
MNSSAIKTGKFMQYVPVNGVYVYFRYDDEQTIMCVINTSFKEQSIDFSNYAERTNGFSKAMNVGDKNIYSTSSTLNIGAQQSLVLELKNKKGCYTLQKNIYSFDV